jgi:hypothetical protein
MTGRVEAEVVRGAHPQAAPSRTRRGPLIAAGLFGAIVLGWFGWQILLKYQRDKDGNTAITIEAKGGDQTADSRPSETEHAAKSSQKLTNEELISGVLLRKSGYQDRPSTFLRPLTAIRWESERPYLEILGRNRHALIAIEDHTIETIIEQAKKLYPRDYRAKIENDLKTLLEHVYDESLERLWLKLRLEGSPKEAPDTWTRQARWFSDAASAKVR